MKKLKPSEIFPETPDERSARAAYREYLTSETASALLKTRESLRKAIGKNTHLDLYKIWVKAINRARDGRINSAAVARGGFFLDGSISQQMKDRLG